MLPYVELDLFGEQEPDAAPIIPTRRAFDREQCLASVVDIWGRDFRGAVAPLD
jgi:hypothetical protein